MKRCAKPGCGAMRLIGRPCMDWDCPQGEMTVREAIAEGFSIVETGRDPVWSLEADDDTLVCRSGTISITIRAETATVFDVASDEAAKVVPVSALSCSTREGKT